ncbi:MAG TPA: hypothetical protein VN791_04405 [Acidimicrobiales bacterium]|nr:hypothetical protein [Acidimicrobiales bacterium]
MAARRRKATVRALPDHLQRTDAWNGLRPGDPVEIEGPTLRGASWTFRAHVRNVNNGAESVEVLGGRPGDHRVRSFLPGQVFPAGARRTGKPSLEAAPQLPLG